MNQPTTMSRSRLKRLAIWIRDELDLLVAREGPNILRPDDVLKLHETFIALRQAENITLQDLRATGIHKAVLDIAGVATRWPSRLCDDCDNIIVVWRARFGPFNDLRPFLYGRGGRLEGIASVAEHSQEALLKRWDETCPEKIHPRRSHRVGNLGWRAGSWWISPLFAHHAGIIGLEACEGGTTYDKQGTYALLLKDVGEIEATSEEKFTYRVPQSDKGKFRLTAATPKSRDAIRVLRSHSINSIWGPRAGVRYEGLYRVVGWSIKMAKFADIAGGAWKEGDILYNIRFERVDLVPMEEVSRRPNATEVDDYSEYKRMRRAYRDSKRKEPLVPIPLTVFQIPGKVAPPIASLLPQLANSSVAGHVSPIPSYSAMFKTPDFGEEAHVTLLPQDLPSPMALPEIGHFHLEISKGGALAASNRRFGRPAAQNIDDGPTLEGSIASFVSSNRTGASTSSRITEVTPWVEFDNAAPMPSPRNSLERIQHSTSQLFRLSHDTESNTTQNIAESRHPNARKSPSPRPAIAQHDRKHSAKFKGQGSLRSPLRFKNLTRSRMPKAKLLDGSEDEAEDVFAGLFIDPFKGATREKREDSEEIAPNVVA